jgi:hypothetical protein
MPEDVALRCSHCRLYNPPKALRYVCGYDFATGTVQQSYVLEHTVRKEGGTAAVLARSARRSIGAGIGIVGVACDHRHLPRCRPEAEAGPTAASQLMTQRRARSGPTARPRLQAIERTQMPSQLPGRQHAAPSCPP